VFNNNNFTALVLLVVLQYLFFEVSAKIIDYLEVIKPHFTCCQHSYTPVNYTRNNVGALLQDFLNLKIQRHLEICMKIQKFQIKIEELTLLLNGLN
jgi:hypothetical protein